MTRTTPFALPLAELVEHVVARSGLVEHYKNEKDG